MNMEKSEIERVLLSETQIADRIKELAKKIDEDYQGKEVIAVCILKGSVIFFADLIRAMKTPTSVEFMKVSSYGFGTSTSGRLSVGLDLFSNIEGKDVLIVEDIIDSGRTLYYLMDVLMQRRPKSMKLCTLLDKPDRRVKDVKVDYVGFAIPDEFVVGYGLDYAQKYRNLPYIGVVEGVE